MKFEVEYVLLQKMTRGRASEIRSVLVSTDAEPFKGCRSPRTVEEQFESTFQNENPVTAIAHDVKVIGVRSLSAT